MAEREDAANSVVVVPWSPGALVTIDPEKRPDRDELDALLDELFGEPTREGPGVFDAALLLGGAALVVASEVADLSNGLLILGAGAFGLGLILPIRDVWQRLIRRRAAGRLQASLAQGLPLNVAHPSTQALMRAYKQLWETGRSATVFGLEALEAAHLAMIEVAGLLQGRRPAGAAEEEYVAARTRALDDLVKAMPPALSDRGSEAVESDLDARDAAVAAVRELEALTGGSSVARIDVLRAVLKRADP